MRATAEFLSQHGIRPSLSRTTVYNTLELLSDNGLVMTLDFGEGFLRYDADCSPHCHFICDGCKKVFDIMDAPPECGSMLPRGFKLKGVQLKLFGTCATCNKKA